MIETFAALFAAHVAADYLAQPRWIVERKAAPHVLATHILIVGALSALALGFPAEGWLALGVLVLAHGAMDAIKTYLLPPDRLWPYLLDQLVHVLTLIVLAWNWPNLVSQGMWADQADALTGIYLVAGFGVFAVMAGGYAVKLLLAGYPAPHGTAPDSLPDAGLRIGQFERALIFVLMIVGLPGGIAVLVAAKSILRFNDIQAGRAQSEVVIIGTLASGAWALLTAIALLMILPPQTLETWGLNAYLR